MSKITIKKFIEDITISLDIPEEKSNLLSLIKDKDVIVDNQELVNKLYNLVDIDKKLKQFEENKIKLYQDNDLKVKYESLKNNLAKMQVLLFKNKDNKIKMLREFVTNLGSKVSNVNDILEASVKKEKKTFRDKYKKYKSKYLMLKNKR